MAKQQTESAEERIMSVACVRISAGLWAYLPVALLLVLGAVVSLGIVHRLVADQPGKIITCSVAHRYGTTLEWPLARINAIDVLGVSEPLQAKLPVGRFHLGAKDVTKSYSGIRLLVPGSQIRIIRFLNRWWWVAELKAILVLSGAVGCLVGAAAAFFTARFVTDRAGVPMFLIVSVAGGPWGIVTYRLRTGKMGDIGIYAFLAGTASAVAIVLYVAFFTRVPVPLFAVPGLAAGLGAVLFWADAHRFGKRS